MPHFEQSETPFWNPDTVLARAVGETASVDVGFPLKDQYDSEPDHLVEQNLAADEAIARQAEIAVGQSTFYF